MSSDKDFWNSPAWLFQPRADAAFDLGKVGGYFGAVEVVRKSATVAITSAQLKAMKATPVTLVDDPSAGTLLVFRFAFVSYIAGGTGYTCAAGDEDPVIEYSGGTDASADILCDNDTGGIDFTATTDRRAFVPAALPGADTVQLDEAEGFQLKNPGTNEWADGDGTVEVTVVYDEYTW